MLAKKWLRFILQIKKNDNVKPSKQNTLFTMHILLELNKDQKDNVGTHVDSQTP
jgi:hypothetical protein